jgi:hypothetical protein
MASIRSPSGLQSQKACSRSPSSACMRKKLACARRMASIRSPYGLQSQKACIRKKLSDNCKKLFHFLSFASASVASSGITAKSKAQKKLLLFLVRNKEVKIFLISNF